MRGLFLICSLFIWTTSLPAQEPTKEDAAKIKFSKELIKIGKVELNVEIARTDREHELGLMFREKLEDGNGMLFIFKEEEVLHFWMKNTLIPLSIGFFDSQKKLIKIMDMTPASPMDKMPQIYSSDKAVLYALEAPKGWFEKRKIKTGVRFSFSNQK